MVCVGLMQQDPLSASVPEQGLLPPLNPLVRLLVVCPPLQALQAPHWDHVPSTEDQNVNYLRHLAKNLRNVSLRQLTVSLGTPEQGVLPPLTPLVLVQVASLLHVPEQVPQALQVTHVPSTEKISKP